VRLTIKLALSLTISEMVHPWCDSCTETSFRRFFAVFVRPLHCINEQSDDIANDATGLWGFTSHSDTGSSSTTFRSGPAQDAR